MNVLSGETLSSNLEMSKSFLKTLNFRNKVFSKLAKVTSSK
jgi:hypothetical protein